MSELPVFSSSFFPLPVPTYGTICTAYPCQRALVVHQGGLMSLRDGWGHCGLELLIFPAQLCHLIVHLTSFEVEPSVKLSLPTLVVGG